MKIKQDWLNSLECGWSNSRKPSQPIKQVWVDDSKKGYKPKIHWSMEIRKLNQNKYVTKVQCRSHGTKYTMPFELYHRAPIEYRCKTCHKQWVKMKAIIDCFEPYNFYKIREYRFKLFIGRLEIDGFNTFLMDSLYMSNCNNEVSWDKEVVHDFNKRVLYGDLSTIKKLEGNVDNLQFWTRYYKLNRV